MSILKKQKIYKRNLHISKETLKRDLYASSTRDQPKTPIYISRRFMKETCIQEKKRSTKETCIYPKTKPQKRAIYISGGSSKETCTSKRDLQISQK